MQMQLESVKTKGHGRGKKLGFPTINLVVPSDFHAPHGIYAATVTISDTQYVAAAHFGPVPTFDQPEPSLECYLLDTKDEDIPDLSTHKVEVQFHQKLRDIIDFDNHEDLIDQISQDVTDIKQYFKNNS